LDPVLGLLNEGTTLWKLACKSQLGHGTDDLDASSSPFDILVAEVKEASMHRFMCKGESQILRRTLWRQDITHRYNAEASRMLPVG